MGIPSYFSHIIEKYSKIVLKNVEKVDNLLMDCNSIIYDVLRKMDISNIDFENEFALVYMTQILPFNDIQSYNLFTSFERLVYSSKNVD